MEYMISDIDRILSKIQQEIEISCKRLVYQIRWIGEIEQENLAFSNAKYFAHKTGLFKFWERMYKNLKICIIRDHKSETWWADSLIGTNADKSFQEAFGKAWKELGPKPSSLHI